jgi:hypothetical protein
VGPQPDAIPEAVAARADDRVRPIARLFGLGVFLVFAYFYGGASWNQNARLDAIFATVEPGTADTGTLHIDRFIVDPITNTGDWARHGGHYYPNKAPGTTLLGVPFYWLLARAEVQLGLDLQDPLVSLVNAYLVHLWVTVLWISVAMAAFLITAHRLLGSIGHALALAVILALCTLVFPFSTQLIGHSTALAWVLLALYCLVAEPGGPGPRSLALAGACSGVAVLTEYITVVTVVALVGWCIWRVRWRTLLFVAGGTPLLACFLAYHHLCFGRALTVATAYSNPICMAASEGGVMFTGFSLRFLGLLLFSLYRGAFVYMPILALTLPALVLWLRREPRSSMVWLCLVHVVAYLGILSSFAGWHGGSCAGPRYLIPGLVFWVLPLGQVLRIAWLRLPTTILAAVSAVNMLVIAAVSPTVPQQSPNPLADELYSRFLAGELSPWHLPIKLHLKLDGDLRRWTAFNWGEHLGLNGLWSLLPVLAVAGLVAVLVLRRLRRPEA